MTYEFIAQQSGEYAVRRLCAVLGVPPSSYYAWRRRPASSRQEANEGLMAQIRRAHCESRGTYGSPRVHQWLRQGGIACGRHRVAGLMRLNGIVGRRSARRWPRTTQRRAGAPVWPNRLRQDFQAERPNQKWVADITYIDTREGWLYLAALMDLCSRRVVGWSMGEALKASLAEDALAMAVGRRRVGEGLLHHSDQGCQYTSEAYQGRLAELQAEVSMSGVGNCYDNAAMESFFSTLKTECATRRFASRSEARREIFEYIELWYNRRRLHSSIGYLSPSEFETRLNSDMKCVH